MSDTIDDYVDGMVTDILRNPFKLHCTRSDDTIARPCTNRFVIRAETDLRSGQ